MGQVTPALSAFQAAWIANPPRGTVKGRQEAANGAWAAVDIRIVEKALPTVEGHD